MTIARGATTTAFASFEESTAEDWAVIRANDETVVNLADHVLDQLRLLGDGKGGFPVDRLEHSLQTATRAERDGRDDDYVLCALVHDIGDNLAPFDHPVIAAAVVKPFVSEGLHWMVAHHGIFQGYYFWHHLGGDRHTRDRYRDSPHWEMTEEFCAKYDQTAFDVDYRSEPLEHFEPLLRAVLSPKRGPGAGRPGR